jgi:hypothetical protein
MKEALTNIFTNLGPIFNVLLEGEYIFGTYGLNSSSNYFVDFILNQYKMDCDSLLYTFEAI